MINGATGELIIHENNFHKFLAPPTGMGMGLVPRDFNTHPVGCYAAAPKASITKIPRSDWPDLIKQMEDSKSRLSDLRNIGMPDRSPIPSRDQNGRGYCWAHSTVSAALLARCRDHLPYADLSAYAIACIIKNYRDEGGWSAQSMEFLASRGCPTSAQWPQRAASSKYDNSNTWTEAALYKDTDWADIQEGDYDTQFTFLLNRFPHTLDLNWWSHSICASDPVNGTSMFHQMRNEDTGKLVTVQEFDSNWGTNVYAGAFGTRIWNSWADTYGTRGMAVLTEGRSRNNGAVALLTMRATP